MDDKICLLDLPINCISHFQVEWTYRWAEIRTFEVTEHAVVAIIKDVKKKLFGMVDNKKIILVDYQQKRLRLMEMLNKLLADQTNYMRL